MDYLRVCAIDAGTRNFAFCVVDNLSWRAPDVWKREDLWEPKAGRRTKPTKLEVIDITYEWCVRNKDLIESCDVVLLENQIRTTFIVMNTVIATYFHSKVKHVHPMTVGTFFKLSRTRDQKKKDGLRICKEFVQQFPKGEKQDDLADAWLMCVYELCQRQAVSKKYFN